MTAKELLIIFLAIVAGIAVIVSVARSSLDTLHRIEKLEDRVAKLEKAK